MRSAQAIEFRGQALYGFRAQRWSQHFCVVIWQQSNPSSGVTSHFSGALFRFSSVTLTHGGRICQPCWTKPQHPPDPAAQAAPGSQRKKEAAPSSTCSLGPPRCLGCREEEPGSSLCARRRPWPQTLRVYQDGPGSPETPGTMEGRSWVCRKNISVLLALTQFT